MYKCDRLHLLVAQREQGIDERRAPGRDVARHQREPDADQRDEGGVLAIEGLSQDVGENLDRLRARDAETPVEHEERDACDA